MFTGVQLCQKVFHLIKRKYTLCCACKALASHTPCPVSIQCRLGHVRVAHAEQGLVWRLSGADDQRARTPGAGAHCTPGPRICTACEPPHRRPRTQHEGDGAGHGRGARGSEAAAPGARLRSSTSPRKRTRTTAIEAPCSGPCTGHPGVRGAPGLRRRPCVRSISERPSNRSVLQCRQRYPVALTGRALLGDRVCSSTVT